ncbi:MAG: restriction endonuclease subunit S [Selenomonadaceae bacterium]|nr:restriction endonuclease subunit S [Selenomonadaceae bacterium]
MVRSYQDTEIGKIPSDWEVDILGNRAQVNRGASPRPIQDYLTDSPDGVNWIKIGDGEAGGKYIASTRERIVREAVSASRYVQQGDFLLSNSMSFGRPYILQIDGCIHDGWLVIQDYNKTLYRDFLYYVLSSDLVQKQYIEVAAGSGVQNLNKDKVQCVQIPIPLMKEQILIAKALSDIDNLISTQESLIAKKQVLKQGAMQELLTGKRRLAGFAGKWQEKTFCEVFDILPNNTFPRDKMQNHPGTIGNIHYGDVLIKYGELLDCQNSEIPYLLDDITINNPRCFAQSGDVIVSDTAEDETVGKVTELANVDGCKVVSGLHTFLCRPKDKDSLALGWLGYYMNAERYHKQILTYVTGIKVSSISKTNIADTVIEIPAKDEQKAIVDVLMDIDRDIANQQVKLEKLRRIKSGMMDKLLTGKIRLTD